MANKTLSKFTPFDLIIIALLSACGVAVKPFVRLLTQALVGTFIPAGTVAGVIYMLWIVLACSIVKKRGTGVLVGIVQAVLVVVFDMLGNRGAANLLVYVLPGISLELGMLMFPRYVSGVVSAFTAGMLANATGALIVGAVFMRLPAFPLITSLLVAFISGGVGGIVGYRLYGVITMFREVQKTEGSEI